MSDYFQEIKESQKKFRVVILEWEERPKKKENIYLLTSEGKRLFLKNMENYSLNWEKKGKNIWLATFAFDNIFGKYRFVGDSYYCGKKKRYIIILRKYGNFKW